MKKMFLLFALACLASSSAFSQNNAIAFDGSGDYMAVPDDELWEFGTGDFTISFWMTLSDLNRIHDGLIGRDDFQWIALEYNHDGDRRLDLWIDSDGSNNWNLNKLKPAKSDWIADTWYHIAIVRSGTLVKILIDGVEAASAEYTQTVFNPSGVPVYFGRSQLANRFHVGLLDDIRIWNYGRSDAEIVESMNYELSGTEPGLIAYWNCNETMGVTAFDTAPGGNDGTLYGDAAFVISDSPLENIPAVPPFSPVDPTGLPYSIIVTEALINGGSFQEATQIGAFDGDLCVGAGVYDPSENMQLVVWESDPSQGLPGFTAGNPITFKVRTTWYEEVIIFDGESTFTQGSGNFADGNYSVVQLAVTTELAPQLSLSAESLNYNIQPINTSAEQQIIVENLGTALLTADLSTTNPVFSVQPQFLSISAGESDTLTVTFTPTAIIQYDDLLLLDSNDPAAGTVEIPLYGMGVPVETPVITVSPTLLTFGGVSAGDTADLSFNIYNAGSGTLLISSITSSDPAFTVPLSENLSLDPGDNQDINVSFYALTPGTYGGTITILSNAEPVSISVTATVLTGHFSPVPPTGLPYTILIESADINGYVVSSDGEVAAYDGDLCVGAVQPVEGAAYHLDGSGDYINIGNPGSLQITGNQTIEMWIYPSDFSQRRNPIAKAYGGEGTMTVEQNGNVNYYYGTGGGNNSPYQGFTMTAPLQVDTWTHLALVRDLDNMTLKWYKNGELVNETNASYPAAAASGLPLYIGRGYVSDFAGMLDEVRIWNSARSQIEIQQNMNMTLHELGGNLAGYWNFDTHSALDLSLNQNNGTLYGNGYFAVDEGLPISGLMQLTAWQEDADQGLAGFTPGNPIQFRIWTTLYSTSVELPADAAFSIGDGTFGFGSYSAAALTADSGFAPDIVVSTDYLYVGQLEINQSVESYFTIYNNGNVPMEVALYIDSQQFTVTPTAASIASGDSLIAAVLFSPEYSGNHSANLQIESDDPDTPFWGISLEGFALPVGEADIDLSVISLSFGGVILNTPETRSFNVINTGTAPLVVSDITANDAQFSVTPVSFTLENTNDNQEVFITLTPQNRGLIEGTLSILSNASASSLNVSGIGYDGHFDSVEATGLPYNIVIESTDLDDYIEIGDEVGVFDGDICVGSTTVQFQEGSLNLDGNGDYYEVPDSPSLDLSGEYLTLEAWVYIDAFSGDYRNIIGKIAWNTSNNWGYNLHINSGGGLHFNFMNTNGTTFALNSPAVVGTQAWHHVAATYGEGTSRLFVDGVEVASRAANGSIMQNNYPVRIGAWWNSDVNYFNGLIDEVRIWNVKRTQSEIQSTMYSELSGDEPGLMGYWQFDLETYDHSPNGNNGNLYGDATFSSEQSIPIGSGFQIVAWQADATQGLPGFTPGNQMSFRVWSLLNDFGSELDATPIYSIGDGSFGYGQFSVCNLEIATPGIMVQPDEFFMALAEPDSAESVMQILNTGEEDLYFETNLSSLDGMFDVSYYYSPGTGASPPIGELIWQGEDQFIDSYWGGGGPGNGVGSDDFQVIWTGEIFTGIDGIYQFRTSSDDGVRLYIDNILIIDAWWDYGQTSHYGSIELTTGYHDLELQYYENGGGAVCYLYWTPPGQSEELTPAADSPSWLSISPESGNIAPGGSADVTLTYRSEGILDGLYERDINILNNAPYSSPQVVPVALNVTGNSQIVSDTGSLDFGDLIVGDADTLSYLLQNIGTASLVIDTILVSGGDFESLHGLNSRISFPFTLSPLNSQELSVAFSPMTEGLQQEILTIVSDAANDDSLEIALQGSGVTPPDILVDPAFWSGTLPSGGVETDTIYVHNQGQASLEYSIDTSVPWLSVSPMSGVLGVGESIAVLLNISTIGVYAGVYEDAFLIYSNDPDEPEITVPLTLTVTGEPQIQLQDVVNFGLIAVNHTGLYPLIIQNTGTDILTLDSLAFSSSVFSIEGDARVISGFPATIAPGTADTLNLAFTPVDPVPYSGYMTLYSNALNAPVLQVVLSGTGILPQIEVSPTELDFGSVVVGFWNDLQLEISSTGTTPVVITGFSTSQGSVYSVQSSLPINLQPGTSTQVSVRFSPQATGAAEDILSIISNDDPLELPLTGIGVSPQLTVTPDSLSFGNVNLYHPETLEIMIYNTGNYPMTINDYTFSGPEAGSFSVAGPAYALAPQDSAQVEVQFSPGSIGLHEALLLISSTGGNSEVVLLGSGITDPPEVALSLSDTTFQEDSPPAAYVDLDAVFTDDYGPLTYGVTNSNPDLLTVNIDANNFVLLTFSPNANGGSTLNFSASDGENTVYEDVVITVLPVPDAPVADDVDVTVELNGSVEITLSGSDVDNELLEYAILDGPSFGSFEGIIPQLLYTPNLDYFGQDTVHFTVSDGVLADTGLVSITVTPLEIQITFGVDMHRMYQLGLFRPEQGMLPVVSIPNGFFPGDFYLTDTDGDSIWTTQINQGSPDEIQYAFGIDPGSDRIQEDWVYELNGPEDGRVLNTAGIDSDLILPVVYYDDLLPVETDPGYEAQVTRLIPSGEYQTVDFNSGAERTAITLYFDDLDRNTLISVRRYTGDPGGAVPEGIAVLGTNAHWDIVTSPGGAVFTGAVMVDYSDLTGIEFPNALKLLTRENGSQPWELTDTQVYLWNTTVFTDNLDHFSQWVLASTDPGNDLAPATPGPASSPTPVNDDMNVPASFGSLSWGAGDNAVWYDLYFWEDGTPEPQTPTAADISELQFDDFSGIAIEPATTYHWYLTSRNFYGETDGPTWTFTVRSLPDLQVTDMQISDPVAGQPLEVTWTITNTGESSTDVPVWYDRLWFSIDFDVRVGEPDDWLIQTFENLSYLEPGQSYVQTYQFDMPNYYVGSYFLLLITDLRDGFNLNAETMIIGGSHGGNIVPELNDYNNFNYVEMSIAPPPTADLVVTSTSAPNFAFSNTEIEILWTVQNTGTVPTYGDQWWDAVYITENQDPFSELTYLGNLVHNGSLLPDSSYSASATFVLPHPIYGDKHLYILTDAYDYEFEYI